MILSILNHALFEQLLVGAAGQLSLAGTVTDHPGQKKDRRVE